MANYDEFIEMKYIKNLNYEVVNQNNFPKIWINIKGKESLYSPEEIRSLIIRKIVKYGGEDLMKKPTKE